jgi:CRP-like cAMP-binding protein
MNDVLALCRQFREIHLITGEILIQESVQTNRLYVLASGAFEVVRNGVRVVEISEAGAFLGEISALLGSPPTATLLATRDSRVYLIEDATASVRTHPELTFAIAQLLARRLSAVTAYLVDIKRQYADSNTHLGLMDQVLANLMAMTPAVHQPGSERSDVPDY